MPGLRSPLAVRSFLIGILAALLTSTGALGNVRLAVDCASGERLQPALAEIERNGGGRVRVSGTCQGGVTWTSDVPLEIIGDSPATTVLQAGAGTAIRASGAGHLGLRNLRLEGGNGVYASGATRVVEMRDCEAEGSSFGVRADSDASVLLFNTMVTGQYGAIRVVDGTVVVEGGQLRDSAYGARSFDGEVFLTNVEVLDNGVGLYIQDRSSVSVNGSSFARNGQMHFLLLEDSRLEVFDSAIGSSGDPTVLSFYVDDDSHLDIGYSDPNIEIWGSATVFANSFVSLSGTTLHGSVGLRSFSKLLLEGSVANGTIDCGSAADAWCTETASAFSSGCPSTPTACTPTLPGGAGKTPTPRRRD